MAHAKSVLSLMAHPDDAEFGCAGTLTLLAKKGWQVHIAMMTPGDCGSAQLNREEISAIRRTEAAASAKILGGTYHCLECDDVFIMYDRVTLLKVIKLIRQVRPGIVFAPSPSDYFVDHEMTSKLARTMCFAAGIENVDTGEFGAFEPIPHLYYVDAMAGKDILGAELLPDILVDISSVMDTKEKMLCCHKSQRDWLLKHHGIDEYVYSMKNFAAKRGKKINKAFAEGFRQHLGDAFPTDNILKQELGDLVHLK